MCFTAPGLLRFRLLVKNEKKIIGTALEDDITDRIVWSHIRVVTCISDSILVDV